ncbi:MAG: nucleoside-diphosphate kinase [Deltaproteobacteria bacterium]|nr:nucleoside-diphosphate kinase [Deltaproteobacteria bacterium]
MSLERTLAIIKPDGVRKNLIGQVLARIEKSGLKVTALQMLKLDQKKAEGFYAVHSKRPFFQSLIRFMTSGPVVVACLEGEGAINHWRGLMGATDPKKAEKGTIRADFADNIEQNIVHGSDAPETAKVEVAYFFK